MDVLSIVKYSAHCEERLRAFHRQDAYEDIAKLQRSFTDEDVQLAQQILEFVRNFIYFDA